MMKNKDEALVGRGVEQLILEVRGQKVLLDEDLAELYGVATKALNQAVSRNGDRFREDFAFRLTRAEATNLKSRTVTSRSEGHGGRRKLPRVFTEEGVAMLSSVLRNKQAVAVNIAIMRAFVRVRHVPEPRDVSARSVPAVGGVQPARRVQMLRVPGGRGVFLLVANSRASAL